VPLPTSGSRLVVRDYLELAQAGGHAPSFYGLEGYVEARILVEALGKLPGPPTREAVVDMLGSFGRMDLGGFEVVYGKTSRQGARFVEMVIIGPNGKLIK
jgi:branched-chain amino acid transport system substrate-binding protein